MMCVMVTFLAAGAMARKAVGSTIVAFKLLGDGSLAIPVKVGEGSTALYTLATGYARSESQVVKGKNPPKSGSLISAGEASIGKIAFAPFTPSQADPEVRGALGIDVLGTMALGFDLASDRVTIWPKGGLAQTEAEAWVRGTDRTSGVSRVPLSRLPGGRPGIPLSFGDRKSTVLLVAGLENSLLLGRAAPSRAQPPALPTTEGSVGLARLGSEDVGWLSFLMLPPKGEAAVKGKFAKIEASGTLSLDAFASRRVLVDFAAGAVYAEKLGPDARASLLIERQASAPLTVVGDRILFQSFSTPDRTDGFADYAGSEVIRIAGTPTEEWLRAVRGTDSQALSRLLETTHKNYTIAVRTADGSERDVRIRAGG